MEEIHFSILSHSLARWTSHNSIISFPKAPISVDYCRFSSRFVSLFVFPRLYVRHATLTDAETEWRKFICNMLRRITNDDFLSFSPRMLGRMFRRTKTLSVYYLPRTDEVDRSVITCVKRISNSLTFFYTKDNWFVWCEVFNPRLGFRAIFCVFFLHE